MFICTSLSQLDSLTMICIDPFPSLLVSLKTCRCLFAGINIMECCKRAASFYNPPFFSKD